MLAFGKRAIGPDLAFCPFSPACMLSCSCGGHRSAAASKERFCSLSHSHQRPGKYKIPQRLHRDKSQWEEIMTGGHHSRCKAVLSGSILIAGRPVFAAEVTPELANADNEPRNWLMNHRTYDSQTMLFVFGL